MKQKKNQEMHERGPLKIEVIRKEEHQEKPKNMRKKIFYALVLIATFVALTSANPAMIAETYNEQEIIIEKKINTIIESYNETRFEEKLVPYTRNICQGDARMEAYRYDYRMDVDSILLEGKRNIICGANVTNKETKAGNFTFYAEIVRSDGVGSNYKDQTKEIAANSSEVFLWIYETTSDKNAVCTLKPQSIPTIARCEVRLDGVSEVKRIPVLVEKQRNKTIIEEKPVEKTVTKTREVEGYKNRLFGWHQPFYLGY